jgi:hypothetical protein
MKCYLIMTISFTSLTCMAEQKNIPVTALTNQIYRRMYCIEQVYQSVDYMRCLNLVKYPSLIRTIIWEYKRFEHCFHTDTARQGFQAIAEEKNLNVLLSIWTDFEQYKYLDDPYFSQDVVRMLFIIAKSLCMTATNENELLGAVCAWYHHMSMFRDCTRA